MTVDSIVSSDHLSAIEKIGVRVEGTFTAEEALTQGGLANWNVRKVPAFAHIGSKKGEQVQVPGMNFVVRDNPTRAGQVDVLGKYPVSDNYQIVQNEDHAEFLNALVDESGANFELAGAMDGGNTVFISMKLPGHILVGGVDPVENSILALNRHDGSMSFTMGVTPVRYACSNVLNNMFGQTSNIIRVRHTSRLETNLRAKARAALDVAFNYLEEFQAEADKMINTVMTQSQFEEIIAREFGVDEEASKAAHTRAEKRVDEMCSLFADSMTQDGIRETAWAGYNALTEWADHFSPTRGDDREASRAAKAILDPSFKQRALQLMTAGV